MKFFIFWLGLIYLSCTQAQAPEKLVLCITCHGQDGIAIQKSWPNLNGQSAKYMLKQLQDYKSGRRISPLMQTYAKLLDDQDMLKLVQFYANLPANTSQKPDTRSIYHQGNMQKRIPACSACHGPEGLGNNFAKFPRLTGQNQTYLIAQLEAFKKHQRQNDAYHMMQDISSRMSKKDMLAYAKAIDALSP